MGLREIAKKAYYKIPSSAVIMLHHVSSSPRVVRSFCQLDTDRLEKLITSFKRTASLAEVVAKPSLKAVAFTIDDGHEDVYTIAYPLFKKYGVPFTTFIITDMIGVDGYMNAEQICSLAADGLVTIGAHGVTHDILTELEPKVKIDNIRKPKEILEELTKKTVPCFAYSHGIHDGECVEAAKIYDFAVGTESKPLNFITAKNKFEIPRFNCKNENYEQVFKAVASIVK